MSLRDSLDLIRMVNPEGGQAVLEHEIMAERASSLGTAESRVVKALAALEGRGDDKERLSAARDAVWKYFVQRELCGFRRHNDVIADLGIPQRVLNGLGAVTR
ncbi:hypothetical protein EMQ25_08185 [Arsenicitalea aurantiaca]|uniref:Uncharacterized protein n=1 Tax=Arsenicitalea aurantiaca TaxID=1783274 RepID=A0A433XG77_9HYPH|nr:DUF6665 family protein [Arsenicitalea aurantiaca]RUT33093.1 hypothetical protein EMQ25_08185 [Arsenicitalea aurantiaca]